MGTAIPTAPVYGVYVLYGIYDVYGIYGVYVRCMMYMYICMCVLIF